MFSLPVGGAGGSSGTTEGKSDTSPIEIPGVTKQEMESFLGFVYFGYVLPKFWYRNPPGILTILNTGCTTNTPSH